MRLTLADAEALATKALIGARTSAANAAPTAKALVAAEADGQVGHGLSRVASYAAQAKVGKVNGQASPKLEKVGSAALRVDADLGFAYPAIDLALRELATLAPTAGIAVAAIHRSHHFGQAGAHAERLAEKGLIGLVFANSPKAMAFWGGKKPMLGTNPIAFACPLPTGAPLVIDLALSVVARGKIMAAQKAGKKIPADWAFDAEGNPTTEPDAALKGSMAAIGGAKGGALAIMVEILAAALTGGQFGWEATSVLDDKGGPPLLGHAILALDPGKLSGGAFMARMGAMLGAMAEEPGVRLPGTRRLENRAKAARDGLEIADALYAEISALAE
ncbi:MAG: Ldh family oxidoreductase [Rhodospirillaceae bacterium]|nr:Ldh family oxidoreductase [Rhodospirillaceae bacterium]